MRTVRSIAEIGHTLGRLYLSLRRAAWPAATRQLVEAYKRARKHNRLQFSPAGEGDHEAEILVVDEASMCTTEHRDAIEETFSKTPVLWVGDPAQLPPVIDEEDKKRGIRPIMDSLEPTATLSTQHRQAGRFYPAGLLGKSAIRKRPFSV